MKRIEVEATLKTEHGWRCTDPTDPRQTHWSVYARDDDGYASWQRDFEDRDTAHRYAHSVARKYNVPVLQWTATGDRKVEVRG